MKSLHDPMPDSSADPHYTGHRQRLKSKFLSTPDDLLPDYELLELLLFYANPRQDMKPLAKKLMDIFGDLGSLFAADREAFKSIDGMGDHGIVLLKLVHTLHKRTLKAKIINRPVFNHWQDVVDYCRLSMMHATREQFRVLFLDKKNRLLKDVIHQEGTLDKTSVYPREIMKDALTLGAAAIIVVHNHPSGDPTPSHDDIKMTQALVDVGHSLGITVLDHLIIGKEKVESLQHLCQSNPIQGNE